MEFIIQTLLADAAVQAIVGNKIFPQVATQETALPYITCFVVSDTAERCREGIASEVIRVQVTAISSTYRECDQLYKAIRAALDGASEGNFSCEWLSANDLYREAGYAHGKAIDFELNIS